MNEMNICRYLCDVVFVTVDGDPIDTTKSFDPDDIQRIDMNYEHRKHFFGYNHGGDWADCGELAKRWPGLFKDGIAHCFHPNMPPETARMQIAMDLLSSYIYYYAEPRFDNDGHYLFSEYTGYARAKEARRSYVIMEDLS